MIRTHGKCRCWGLPTLAHCNTAAALSRLCRLTADRMINHTGCQDANKPLMRAEHNPQPDKLNVLSRLHSCRRRCRHRQHAATGCLVPVSKMCDRLGLNFMTMPPHVRLSCVTMKLSRQTDFGYPEQNQTLRQVQAQPIWSAGLLASVCSRQPALAHIVHNTAAWGSICQS